MSNDHSECSREWYDSNGFPYPIHGVGTDNSIAPWLMWCDECKRYHLHDEHNNKTMLRPTAVVNAYDSRPDTQAHINRVASLLMQAVDNLRQRAVVHDASKLESPEREVFDAVTPKLKAMEYGSDEYKASLAEMGTALNHHYANNSHHPERFALTDYGVPNPDELKQGAAVARMTLFDLIECLVDWKAASERHTTGDIWKSIEMNKERFGLTEQLYGIFRETAKEMGW